MYGSKLLSKEAILEKITPYDIFKYYIPSFKDLGIKFRSELRKDTKPTCSVKRVGLSFLYRDFAEFETLDCFSYVMKKYNISFFQALQLIDKDFNLGLSSFKIENFKEPPKYEIEKLKNNEIEKYEINIVKRNFIKADQLFWTKLFEIPLNILEDYKIYPISGFYLNGIYYKCNLAYAYEFNINSKIYYKIYQPYEKSQKWLNNCPSTYLQGINNLEDNTDLLIITKSLKDVIVLKLIGINAVAPQGETVYFDSHMDIFKEKYKRIVLLYDNDSPGVKASKIISERYDIEELFLPNEIAKDVSDFVKEKSLLELEKFIYDRLNLSSSNTKI